MTSTVLEILRRVRRAVLMFFGAQLAFAVGLSLVDSYRRRGKKPLPFPVSEPTTVELGGAGGLVTTYTYGDDLYDDMLAAIEGAERQILFETYIWKADEVGERFKNALAAAADRGVEVYCVYDGFANLTVSPLFKQFPDSMRVLRYPVYSAGWRFFDLSRYGRNHRKMLVVDNSVGFIGGYNIGEPYRTEWRDTHLRITGPAVWDLNRAFVDFWNLNRRRRIGQSQAALQLPNNSTWEPAVRVQRNVPRLWMFPIRSMYLEAINRSNDRIWLTCAYFIPDSDVIDALCAAAYRGVDVRILVPKLSNHIVADWISRGYYSQLLSAGVRILRFTGAMVHAKTATVDGTWTTVGTANLDRLSLQGNYEINLEVFDADLAEQMERIFTLDETNCEELTPRTWEARTAARRFAELVLAPLRPLL